MALTPLVKSIIHRLQYLLIMGFVLTLIVTVPLPTTRALVNNVMLVALLFNTFLLAVFGMTEPKHSWGSLLVFTCIYLMYVISFAQTKNFDLASIDLIERKVGLFLFPLILFFSPRLTPPQTRNILTAFVVSCAITAAYSFIVASYRYFHDHANNFTYHELSQIVGKHAIYLSMFYFMAVAILGFLAYNRWEHWRTFKKASFICCWLLFLVSILLLSARLHLMLLCAGGVLCFFYYLKRKFSFFVASALCLVAGLIIVLSVLSIPNNRERFKQLINYKGQYKVQGEWGEQHIRFLIWTCAVELIKKKPLQGYGSGDVQEQLTTCYNAKDYGTLLYFKETKFNAHSQYLETTLATGIGGLFALLGCFAYGFWKGLAARNYLYCIFIVLFSLSCISESFFERQIGVVFFAFFNSFLFYHNHGLE